MSASHVGYWAAVTIGLGCLVAALSLVAIRVHADRAERRTRELRTPLWRVVLMLGAGEPDEIEEARARLLALTPEERRAVEDDAFALVPRLRGEARDRGALLPRYRGVGDLGRAAQRLVAGWAVWWRPSAGPVTTGGR